MIIMMFSEETLASSDFNGRKITYAKTDSYVYGKDLLLGLNDSLEFLKTVPSKSVKLVVTSPSYNIGKIYEERVKLGEYLDYQGKVARECVRIHSEKSQGKHNKGYIELGYE